MKSDIFLSWYFKRTVLKDLLENECITSPIQDSGIPGIGFGIRVYSCVLNEAEDGYTVCFALVVQSKYNVEVEFDLYIDSNQFKKKCYHVFTPAYSEYKIVVSSANEFFNCELGFFDGLGRMKLNVRGNLKCYIGAKRPLCNYLQCADDKDFFMMVSGKSIQVHKSVLRQYSSVFALIFDIRYEDVCENVVQIKDFNYGTVRRAIDFCYGNPFPNDILLLIDLMRFADKYFMKELMNEVEDRLCDFLDSYLVVFILNQTFAFASDRFISYCMKMLVDCIRKCVPVYENEKLSDQIRLKLFQCLFDS